MIEVGICCGSGVVRLGLGGYRYRLVRSNWGVAPADY